MKSSDTFKIENEKTIAITGAAGQVSYALYFMLAQSDLFGKNVQLRLNLIDHSRFLKKLEGTRLELIDCAFPHLGNIIVTSDLNSGIKDADWIILNGGLHQKPHMTKTSFIKLNAKLIASQAKVLNTCNISKNTKILVVANPVNINCNILSYFAPDFPKENIFGLSYLDHTRALSALSTKLSVTPDKINNLSVWGNHSCTIYASIENCTIKSRQLRQVQSLKSWHKKHLIPLIQHRGENIIKLRDHNSAGSAAKVIIDAISSIENRTQSKRTFSMICASNGEYGIKKNIWFSFPCISKNKAVKVIKNLSLNSYSKRMILLSEQEILNDLESAQQLGYWKW